MAPLRGSRHWDNTFLHRCRPYGTKGMNLKKRLPASSGSCPEIYRTYAPYGTKGMNFKNAYPRHPGHTLKSIQKVARLDT